ncbi:DUF3307 domain-containing protein [Meridianimarinicoccus aquatilis]|uniref:DUF3307 domain-containing protein n=2 Tax=Meridianimarinicoccus aquatilis TaxID=2552766 RepID=A0A4V3BAT7_9RHOB|nr:DUF3307 domain-containing protein [Fluviibacterium aquatile]
MSATLPGLSLRADFSTDKIPPDPLCGTAHSIAIVHVGMEFHSSCPSLPRLFNVIETFAALAIAHVASDFVFQSRWIAQNKTALWPMSAHIAIVAVTSWTALGFSALFAVLLLSAAHLAMDLLKSRHLKKSGGSFGIDQGFHICCILIFAMAQPNAWSNGLWASVPGNAPSQALALGVLAMGAIYATRGGLFFVEHIVTPNKCTASDWRSLNSSTHRLATWQRATVFLGMLIGPMACAAICAVYVTFKLWHDRNTDRPNGTMSGMLGSFAWAIFIGFGTHVTLSLLPTLDAARMGPYPLL